MADSAVWRRLGRRIRKLLQLIGGNSECPLCIFPLCIFRAKVLEPYKLLYIPVGLSLFLGAMVVQPGEVFGKSRPGMRFRSLVCQLRGRGFEVKLCQLDRPIHRPPLKLRRRNPTRSASQRRAFIRTRRPRCDSGRAKFAVKARAASESAPDLCRALVQCAVSMVHRAGRLRTGHHPCDPKALAARRFIGRFRHLPKCRDCAVARRRHLCRRLQ
jgi:hypothetical protein